MRWRNRRKRREKVMVVGGVVILFGIIIGMNDE
jgi:hypothetical protein